MNLIDHSNDQMSQQLILFKKLQPTMMTTNLLVAVVMMKTVVLIVQTPQAPNSADGDQVSLDHNQAGLL